jgi:hypothetical protein
MSTDVINFSRYTSGWLCNHYNIAGKNSCAVATMQALHMIMCREMGQVAGAKTKTDLVKAALDKAIEKIGIRYRLYQDHAKTFLQGEEDPDFESLSIAIILKDHITAFDFSLPVNDNGDNAILKFLQNHIEEKRRYLAGLYYRESVELQKAAPLNEYAQESLLLAHICALDDFYNIGRGIDCFSFTELHTILEHKIIPAYSFTALDKPIGKQLHEELEGLKDYIQKVLNQGNQKTPVAVASHPVKLTLVELEPIP